MKNVLLLLVVVMVAVCVSGQGIPLANCPPGEHSVLYCPRVEERSCDYPDVEREVSSKPCDIPDCFCDTPTVRNTKTKKCVRLSECPRH